MSDEQGRPGSSPRDATSPDVVMPVQGQSGELVGRATRSFLWATASFVGSRLISFLAVVLLARILVPDDFGVVAAAMTVFLFIEFALDLGMGAALIFEQERGITDRVHTAFTLNLMVAIAMAAGFFFAAPWIADFFRVPDQVQIFRTLSLLIVVKGLSQIPDSLFKRDLEFKRRTAVDVSRAGVRLAVAVALAMADFGAWSIVWGTLAGECVGVVLSWALLGFSPRFVFQRRVARELLGFGMTVLGYRALEVFATNADYLVVGNQLGPRMLSFYYFAFRLPQLVIGNVYNVFSQVAFPTYSQARERGSATLERGMLRSLKLLALFGFTTGTGLALASRDLADVMLPPDWAPAALPMALIALTFGLQSVGFASGDIFPAIGKPGFLLKMNLVASPILVVALILAAPRGINAVAAVHLVLTGIYSAVRLVFAVRLVQSPLSRSLVAMWPALVISIGIVVGALPVLLLFPPGALSLVVIVAAGLAGAYVAGVLFTRSVFSDAGELLGRALRSNG